ncbi:MAG: RpiB/LacA/LacB family sugar-phosphate isomerase [Lachnospiraceae bacterium]
MKIAVGCDPNAQSFKEEMIAYVQSLGHECFDFGSENPIYAEVAVKVATAVAAKEYDRGILICGTGIGMSIAANKVKGAYAALVNEVFQAQRAELSNHANIITMGSQVTGIETAKMMVKEYLANTFDEASRSMPKIQRIYDFEQEVMK